MLRNNVNEQYPVTFRKKLPGLLWTVLLSVLTAAFALGTFLNIWKDDSLNMLIPVFAVTVAILLCAVTNAVTDNKIVCYSVRLVPWAVLLPLLGPGYIWQGLLSWLNSGISRWNAIHQGGIPLLSASSSSASTMAFSIALAFLAGQLAENIVSRRRVVWSSVLTGGFIFVQLFTGTFSELVCTLGLIGVLGVWCFTATPHSVPLRQSLRPWAVCTIALAVCLSLVSTGELAPITKTRESFVKTVHDVRYGEDSLPLGHVDKANELHSGADNLLSVTTQQEKALYLRGFVGDVYTDGVWSPMPDSAYGGEYSGMLSWLAERGFDPLSQPAEYQRLTHNSPEPNKISVSVDSASRYYVYLPATAIQVDGTRVRDNNDTRLAPKGFFGAKSYTAQEISPVNPSELTVRAAWVSNPQTEEQKNYVNAEALYREFVFEKYTETDKELYPLLRDVFWSDESYENNGIYSAVTHLRDVLKKQTQLAKDADVSDSIKDFLTGSGKGNAVLYASTAVQALRSNGIPARYVEGYYLSVNSIKKDGGKNISLGGANAHAWVEVYFDGVGWLPVDVTPGYYYDTLMLSQMVAMPDKAHKTAAVDNDSDDNSVILTGGGSQNKHFPEDILKILPVFGGAAACIIILITLAFVIMEIMRMHRAKYELKAFDTADPKRKAWISYRKLFHICAVYGIDATLGWKTEQTDKSVSDTIEAVAPGDYLRVAELLEKSIYGNIELEPHEMRTVAAMLEKVGEPPKGKHTFKKRAKLRYLPVRMYKEYRLQNEQ